MNFGQAVEAVEGWQESSAGRLERKRDVCILRTSQQLPGTDGNRQRNIRSNGSI